MVRVRPEAVLLMADHRRVLAIVGLLPLLAVTAACATDSTDPGVPGDVTGANLADLSPLNPLPESRPVSNGPVVVHPPSAFQQSEVPTDAGPALVLSRGSEPDLGVPRIVVTSWEVSEPVGMDVHLDLLEGQVSLQRGAVDVERHDIDWPGAADAGVLSWIRPATSGDVAEERTVHLVLVTGNQEVSVIAVAPVAEFEDSGVLDVLRTVELGGG